MVTVLDDLKSDRNLLSATIEITYRCNFKCNYCFQKSLRKSYGKELDISDWKKILDILADNGCIRLVFTGGEICMKKDMDKIY